MLEGQIPASRTAVRCHLCLCVLARHASSSKDTMPTHNPCASMASPGTCQTPFLLSSPMTDADTNAKTSPRAISCHQPCSTLPLYQLVHAPTFACIYKAPSRLPAYLAWAGWKGQRAPTSAMICSGRTRDAETGCHSVTSPGLCQQESHQMPFLPVHAGEASDVPLSKDTARAYIPAHLWHCQALVRPTPFCD